MGGGGQNLPSTHMLTTKRWSLQRPERKGRHVTRTGVKGFWFAKKAPLPEGRGATTIFTISLEPSQHGALPSSVPGRGWGEGWHLTHHQDFLPRGPAAHPAWAREEHAPEVLVLWEAGGPQKERSACDRTSVCLTLRPLLSEQPVLGK